VVGFGGRACPLPGWGWRLCLPHFGVPPDSKLVSFLGENNFSGGPSRRLCQAVHRT